MSTEGIESEGMEKEMLLGAPRQRIWRALTDAAEFGTWFGARFDGRFTPGARLHGVIVPTKVDAEVANAQQEYEGKPFEITVERMEPERLFSIPCHPYAGGPPIHIT